MADEKKVSEVISDFVRFLNDAQFSYTYVFDKVNEQDKLTQDILHSLELDGLKYSERARLATKLAAVRKERRMFKDIAEELEPVANFMEENKKLLNNFGALVGAVRKREKYHSSRRYIPRIIKKEDI